MSINISDLTLVGGFPSNSASPSDLCVARGPENKEYVLKVFPSSTNYTPDKLKMSKKIDTYPDILKNLEEYLLGNIESIDTKRTFESIFKKNDLNLIDSAYFKGMEYEGKIYKQVREELIEPRVCENFVISPKRNPEGPMNVFGDSSVLGKMLENVDLVNIYDSIIHMMLESSLDDDKDHPLFKNRNVITNHSPSRKYFLSSLFEKIYKNLDKKVQKKITKSGFVDTMYVFFGDYLKNGKSLFKLDFVFTERVNASEINGTKTLLTVKSFFKSIDLNQNRVLVYEVLAQLFYACVKMSEIGVFHNDLHNKNALIELNDKGVKVNFKRKDGSDYSITTKVFVRVFDFDRSYSVKHRDNPLVRELGLCENFHTCNSAFFNRVVNKNKGPRSLMNLLPAAAWIYGCRLSTHKKALNRNFSELVIDLISSDEESKYFIRNLFDNTCITNSANNSIEFKSEFGKVKNTNAFRKKAKGPSKDLYGWKYFKYGNEILETIFNKIDTESQTVHLSNVSVETSRKGTSSTSTSRGSSLYE